MFQIYVYIFLYFLESLVCTKHTDKCPMLNLHHILNLQWTRIHKIPLNTFTFRVYNRNYFTVCTHHLQTCNITDRTYIFKYSYPLQSRFQNRSDFPIFVYLKIILHKILHSTFECFSSFISLCQQTCNLSLVGILTRLDNNLIKNYNLLLNLQSVWT